MLPHTYGCFFATLVVIEAQQNGTFEMYFICIDAEQKRTKQLFTASAHWCTFSDIACSK